MTHPSGLQATQFAGYRLIEITWPPQPTSAEVRDFVFALYDLWDSEPDTPSVALNDLRQARVLTDEEFQIVRIILGRMRLHPAFVAGAFYVGDNDEIRAVMERALVAAKRPTDSLHTTREEALAYLNNAIEAHRRAAR